VLLLQQLHDYTDAETVEAVTFNLAWHYALAVPPGANIYICERTLRNYRRVVITQGLDVQLFRDITDALVQACAANTSSQRIDSTVVRSAMRTLTRLGIVVATVRKFLRELARRYSTLYATVDQDVIRLYVERRGTDCFALTKPQEAQRRLPEAVTILDASAQQFADTEATTLASYLLLTRMLTEQCERVAASGPAAAVRIKEPARSPARAFSIPPILMRATMHSVGRAIWRKSWKRIPRMLRRFLQKNILSQDVEAGRIRISQSGNSGWRSSRASTACLARLLSVTPFWATSGQDFPMLE
jgi:hypothetical protein